MSIKNWFILFIISVIVFAFLAYARAAEFENPASLYKDNYFITGWEEDTQVKFQVSIEYSLFYPSSTGVFLGYTQLSKWDLYSKSAPFEENNYMPEAFFRFESNNNYWDTDLGVIDYIQVSPIYHRSNGKDGLDSRGENLYYGQVQLSVGKINNFGVNVKVYNYYSKSKKNYDINEYHHNYEADIFYKLKSEDVKELDKEEIHCRFSGNPFDKGFVEGTVKFRIVTSILQVRAYGQVYHGYDEFIRDYNKKDTAVRVGLCF